LANRKQGENLDNQLRVNLDKITELESKLKESLDNNAHLTAEVSEFESKLESLKTRNSALTVKYNRLQKELNNVLATNEILSESYDKLYTAYLNSRCKSVGVEVELVEKLLPENPSLDDIEKVLKESASVKRRMSKLSFSTEPIIVEGVSTVNKRSDDKLANTRNLLESMKK
jgi:chromosome segregation ATPase